MTDVVGRADYELGANLGPLEAAINNAEAKLQASGQKVEQAFAGAGNGFDDVGTKAAAAANTVTTGFAGDAAKALDTSGKSAGRFGGILDGIKSKAKGVGGVLSGIGSGIMAGLGIGAVLGVANAVGTLIGKLGEAQEMYREDQVSQAQLNAALKANIPAFDGNTKAIEDTIAARMRLGFADEDQRASLAQLVTRTHDYQKALDLQRTAMDLARLKGISLEQASLLVGKAYSGQVSALTRAGIAIDANATSTEALAAIQKAAAGQAEDYAATSDGKVTASQLRQGEAMERIGAIVAKISDAVAPLFAAAMEFIADSIAGAAEGVEKFVQENKLLFDILGSLAGFLVTVVGAGFQSMGNIVSAVFGIIGNVISGIAGFVKPILQGIISAVRSVMDVASQIPGPWQDAAKSIRDELARMEADAAHWGEATVDTAAQTPTDAASAIAAGAGEMGDAADEALYEPVYDAAAEGRKAAVREAKKTPQEAADALRSKRTAWQDAWSQLKQDMEHPMSRAKERAKILAKLTGDNLAEGLKSKDPVILAQAEATKAILEGRLKELDGEIWGRKLGFGFADGLAASAWRAGLAAEKVAAAASDNLRVSSPAKRGPLSLGGGPEGFGSRLVNLYAVGMERALGAVDRVSARVASAALIGPQAAAYAGATAPGVAGMMLAAGDRSARNATSSSSSFQMGDIHLHGIGSDVSPAAARHFAAGIRDEVTAIFREQSRRSGSLSPVRR